MPRLGLQTFVRQYEVFPWRIGEKACERKHPGKTPLFCTNGSRFSSAGKWARSGVLAVPAALIGAALEYCFWKGCKPTGGLF